LISIVVFSSCNQSPPTASQSIIPDEDLINAIHVTSDTWNLSQSSAYFEQKLYNGVASRVLLGRNNYSETDMLCQFSIYVDDTTLTYLKAGTATITRAWMVMNPTYILGDTTEQFGFSAYQIRNPWGLYYFNRDSLETIISNKDSKNVISMSNSTPSNPALKDSIMFDINTDVVTKWVTYDSTVASAEKNYGLIFIPSAGTKKVLGFNPSSSTDTSDVTYMKFTIHKDGWAKDDTVYVTPYMDTHITKHTVPLPTVADEIYLEGSYVVRGFLKFDLSQVPSNIILNKVILTMEMDPSKSLNGKPTTDSIGVTVLADSSTKAYTKDSTVVTLITRKGNIFSGDITWMVQDWIKKNNVYSNHGVLLYLFDDAATAARLVLYGGKYADKSKRPKLDIYYTQKN
jgi:hypothetical protein